MLASFGLLYVVQNIARIIWGSQTYQVLFLNRTVTAAQIPLNRLVALGVVIVVAVALLPLPGPHAHGQGHPSLSVRTRLRRD